MSDRDGSGHPRDATGEMASPESDSAILSFRAQFPYLEPYVIDGRIKNASLKYAEELAKALRACGNTPLPESVRQFILGKSIDLASDSFYNAITSASGGTPVIQIIASWLDDAPALGSATQALLAQFFSRFLLKGKASKKAIGDAALEERLGKLEYVEAFREPYEQLRGILYPGGPPASQPVKRPNPEADIKSLSFKRVKRDDAKDGATDGKGSRDGTEPSTSDAPASSSSVSFKIDDRPSEPSETPGPPASTNAGISPQNLLSEIKIAKSESDTKQAPKPALKSAMKKARAFGESRPTKKLSWVDTSKDAELVQVRPIEMRTFYKPGHVAPWGEATEHSYRGRQPLTQHNQEGLVPELPVEPFNAREAYEVSNQNGEFEPNLFMQKLTDAPDTVPASEIQFYEPFELAPVARRHATEPPDASTVPEIRPFSIEALVAKELRSPSYYPSVTDFAPVLPDDETRLADDMRLHLTDKLSVTRPRTATLQVDIPADLSVLSS